MIAHTLHITQEPVAMIARLYKSENIYDHIVPNRQRIDNQLPILNNSHRNHF